MPPLTKDAAESFPAVNVSRLRTVAVTEDGARPQPVCIEVPITVQGVRAAKPGDLREPFTEATRTVIVFANGAVVRLAAPVNAGQPLFLTNESTHKEIVCQVVKSKTYASVPGYVEVEFTEPNVGFWGMRFPTDRLQPQTEPASREAVPSVEERRPAVPPVRPTVAPEIPAASPAIVAAESPELTIPPATPVVVPEVPAAPAAVAPPENLPSLSHTEPVFAHAAQQVEESEPAVAPARPPVVPEGPALSPPPLAPAERVSTLPQSMAHPAQEIHGAREASTHTPPVQPAHEVTTPHVEARVPAPSLSRARAAHPTPTPLPLSSAASVSEPLVFSGKTRPSQSAGSHAPSPAIRQPAAVFTASLLEKKEKGGKARSNSAVAGLVAAGVLFAAAGGGWYWWQHGRLSSEHRGSTASSANNGAAPAVVAANSPAERVAAGEPTLVPSAAVSTSAHPLSRPSEAASSESVTKSEKAGKKRAVPQYGLSAPVVSRPDSSAAEFSAAPEVAPQVSENVPPSPLSGMVPTQASQPTAPRVTQAVPPKRISWIAPLYPALARSQRIQGDVTLDVLIEANGRPSAVKVLSGPTLLQQAAVNAVRQWKYQPGMVDGSPVPVHISVAVTFRIN